MLFWHNVNGWIEFDNKKVYMDRWTNVILLVNNRDITENMKKYLKMVTAALVLNIFMILLWLVYSGYQCYIAREEEQIEEKPKKDYTSVSSTDRSMP